MTKPSILFVTRKWPPAVGGMETYCVELVHELRSRTRLELIALPGNEDGSAPRGVSLVWFGLTAAWKLIEKGKRCDIVQLGDMAIWPLGVIARLAGRQVKLVLSAHGTDVGYHRRGGLKGQAYRLYMAIGARLCRKALVIANSATTARAAGELGWRCDTVVPLATRAPDATCAAIPGRNLLFAGRLVERKGLGWFVREVLPLLPETIGVDVAGPVWDEREAEGLGQGRVIYLGALSRNALDIAYRGALAVIIPNIEVASGEFEGFGLVAVEAAAAGAVVIAADRDGLVEAVRDGRTGFLVTSGDAPAWADAIRRIDRWTQEEREAFVTTAQETARTYYDWARVAEDMLREYRKALPPGVAA